MIKFCYNVYKVAYRKTIERTYLLLKLVIKFNSCIEHTSHTDIRDEYKIVLSRYHEGFLVI